MRTLFCDIGNVVVSFDHDKGISQIAECCGIEREAAKELLDRYQLIFQLETGRINESQFCEMFLQHGTLSPDHQEIVAAWNDMFAPIEAMCNLLDALRTAGIRLVALSNISAINHQFLCETFQLFAPFHELVLSYEVGAMKPDHKIFERALAVAECPPHECFYIDDIEEYVTAARQLGIDSEVFTGPERFVEHLQERGVSFQVS